MIMRKHLGLFIVLVTLILSSCSSGKKENGRIVVSIPPQAFIAKQLLGENTEVVTIVNSNANPEIFEPAMNTMFSLMNSDVYFAIGTLPFEDRLIVNATLKKENVNVVDCSEGVGLLYDTHEDCGHSNHDGHNHSDRQPDPHIWSTPGNMSLIAVNMAKELVRLYPDRKNEIESNLKNLQQRLATLDEKTRSILKKDSVGGFMIWHPSLSYFADEYGIEQIPVSAGAKEISAKSLAERLKQISDGAVNLMILQNEFDPSQIKPLVKDIDIKTHTLNQMSEDWLSEYDNMITAFEYKDGQVD